MTAPQPPTADALRAFRARLRLTQADLAARLGVWPPTVARWEQGDRIPPPYLALALDRLADLHEQENPPG